MLLNCGNGRVSGHTQIGLDALQDHQWPRIFILCCMYVVGREGVVHPCSDGAVFVAVLTLDAECHDHYFPSLPVFPLQSKLLLDTGSGSTGIID